MAFGARITDTSEDEELEDEEEKEPVEEQEEDELESSWNSIFCSLSVLAVSVLSKFNLSILAGQAWDEINSS